MSRKGLLGSFSLGRSGKSASSTDLTPAPEPEPAPKLASSNLLEYNLKVTIVDYKEKHVVATVVDPQGKSDVVSITQGKHNIHIVHFYPKMPGPHLLKVTQKGKPIHGSPFNFEVKPRSAMVRAEGEGLELGGVDHPVYFKVITAAAGQGELAILITGPDEPGIDIEETEMGHYKVKYEPKLPGEYTIDIKFNDSHIPGSPFTSFIQPASPSIESDDEPESGPLVAEVDLALRSMNGQGISSDTINGSINGGISSDAANGSSKYSSIPRDIDQKPAVNYRRKSSLKDRIQASAPSFDFPPPAGSFSLRKRQHKISFKITGSKELDLAGQVTDPEGNTRDVRISSSKDDRYIAKFDPQMNGYHILTVKNKGIPVKGSPFRFRINLPDDQTPRTRRTSKFTLEVTNENNNEKAQSPKKKKVPTATLR